MDKGSKKYKKEEDKIKETLKELQTVKISNYLDSDQNFRAKWVL